MTGKKEAAPPETGARLCVRTATEADAARLLEIYAPYVEGTAVSFEYGVPAVEEFRRRIRATLARYPYVVAEADGALLGYAYAGALKERAAYDWAVETSVYVRRDAHGRGVGRALYGELERRLRRMGVRNMYACIAYAGREDPYLDNASTRFHERMGFRLVAHFHQCGYKFGRWYDMVWMERMIGPHD